MILFDYSHLAGCNFVMKIAATEPRLMPKPSNKLVNRPTVAYWSWSTSFGARIAQRVDTKPLLKAKSSKFVILNQSASNTA